MTADNASDVAEVSVSVTNSVEFYKIAGKFQETQFTPSTESLLADAITTTSSIEARYYDAVKAALGVAFSGPSINRSRTSSTDEEGKVTETSTQAKQRQTPNPPTEVSITLNPPTESSPQGLEAGTEAQLKYQIAKALSEQIVILNSHMDNLSHRRKFRPYFVTIRITIQPKNRRYPYDTYLDLSFSSAQTGRRDPVVLPLLVSDALENTRQIQTSNIVRQLGAELKGSAGFVGASASLERTLARLDDTLSLRPNSLLSVAKSTDQTISIRLGANAIGDSYEMIPRTHIISLVLLVPNKAAKAEDGNDRGFNIGTKVSYRDAAAKAAPLGPQSLAYAEYFEVPQKEPMKCPPLQSTPLLVGTLTVPKPDALPTQDQFPIQLAILSGGRGLEGHPLGAELSFADSGNLSVMAQDVRPTPFGLRIAFPDISPFLTAKRNSRGFIRLIKLKGTGGKETGGDEDSDDEDDCNVRYVALFAPKSADLSGNRPQSAASNQVSAGDGEAAGETQKKEGVKVKERSAPASSPPK
jgi:hypothetical protein